MELQFLKLLLKRSIYNKYINKLDLNYFSDKVQLIIGLLIKLYEDIKDEDLSIDKLQLLFFVSNPTLSVSQKEVYEDIFRELKTIPETGDEVSSAIFNRILINENARRIAEKAIEIVNKGSSDFSALKAAVQELEQSSENVQEYLTPVTTDIERLIAESPEDVEFKFNIIGLNRQIPGVGRGTFIVLFARPESGKTACWVSFAAAAGGYLSQGKKVMAVINEEPARRTMFRAISAATGLTQQQILADPKAAVALFEPVRRNLCLYDSVSLHLDQLDALVSVVKPDVLVIDQLDKVKLRTSHAREDQRLKELYVNAREIVKGRNLLGFGVSQASAEGENEAYLTFDMLENSRTGKAAEADIVIGIGKKVVGDKLDTPHRTFYFPKNKINGWHGIVPVYLKHQISTFTD